MLIYITYNSQIITNLVNTKIQARNKNLTVWGESTNYRAPHKPILLLSVLDLVVQGNIKQPFVEPNFDLIERFSSYWNLLMPAGSKCNIAYPFYRMQSEGFWRLVPKPGQENLINETIESSVTTLKKYILGAEIDSELFRLICADHSRERIQELTLNTYFSKKAREALFQEIQKNKEATEYSYNLLQVAEHAQPYGEKEKYQQVRGQGFRKAIMNLYNYRCVICGIRMLTPEGHTVVEAAHIHPWSESNDDRPANGLALCKLCHWNFDEGFISVGEEYEVLVSSLARSEQNNPGHIMTFEQRSIFKPEDVKHTPDQNCLQLHRERIFRTT